MTNLCFAHSVISFLSWVCRKETIDAIISYSYQKGSGFWSENRSLLPLLGASCRVRCPISWFYPPFWSPKEARAHLPSHPHDGEILSHFLGFPSGCLTTALKYSLFCLPSPFLRFSQFSAHHISSQLSILMHRWVDIYPPLAWLFCNKQASVMKMEVFLNCFQVKFCLDRLGCQI